MRHTLGLGVGDPRPKRLYERLGYVDTGQDYLDRYVWVDDHHVEHPVAERCRWMMKPLSGGGWKPVEADAQHGQLRRAPRPGAEG